MGGCGRWPTYDQTILLEAALQVLLETITAAVAILERDERRREAMAIASGKSDRLGAILPSSIHTSPDLVDEDRGALDTLYDVGR